MTTFIPITCNQKPEAEDPKKFLTQQLLNLDNVERIEPKKNGTKIYPTGGGKAFLITETLEQLNMATPIHSGQGNASESVAQSATPQADVRRYGDTPNTPTEPEQTAAPEQTPTTTDPAATPDPAPTTDQAPTA